MAVIGNSMDEWALIRPPFGRDAALRGNTPCLSLDRRQQLGRYAICIEICLGYRLELPQHSAFLAGVQVLLGKETICWRLAGLLSPVGQVPPPVALGTYHLSAGRWPPFYRRSTSTITINPGSGDW